MTSLGLSAILQLAVLGAGGESYAEAHKESTDTGRPLVVLVGADWCPACNVMKDTVVPQLRHRGLLRKVAFAVVNLDRDRKLGSQLTEDGPIPQLVGYRRTRDGWRMYKLIGGQDVETVESFFNETLQANESNPPDKDGPKPRVATEGSGQTTPSSGTQPPKHG
jgi:thioredoxin-like negative regulator of GroEL